MWMLRGCPEGAAPPLWGSTDPGCREHRSRLCCCWRGRVPQLPAGLLLQRTDSPQGRLCCLAAPEACKGILGQAHSRCMPPLPRPGRAMEHSFQQAGSGSPHHIQQHDSPKEESIGWQAPDAIRGNAGLAWKLSMALLPGPECVVTHNSRQEPGSCSTVTASRMCA